MIGKIKSLKGRFHYDDSEMPFLEHLEEFRKMIIRAFIAIVAGMAIAAFFIPWLKHMLFVPGQAFIDSDQILLQLDITTGFKMWFTLAFWSGLVVSMPALMLIIGAFVLPGIKDSERRMVQRVGFFSGLLFVAGVLFAYLMILPMAIQIMVNMNIWMGGDNIWTYQRYIDFTLQVLLGFGIAFQMPIVVILLGRMGIISSRQLRDKRRHVVVGLFILSMLLTPPDPASQIQMSIPLILMYEFCIWFLYFSEKGGRAPKDKPDLGDGDERTAKHRVEE